MDSLEICFCVMALICCDTFAVLKLQTVHNNAVLVAKIKDAKYILVHLKESSHNLLNYMLVL